MPLPELGSWCRTLDDASHAERAAALAEADELRLTSDADEDSWRALTVYRALADLALAGPHADARAAWMTREDPARDATTRRFAQAALQEPGDVGVRAEVVLAECDTRAGEERAAEARLRALWPRVRGTASVGEVWTCNALAEVFAVQRREFEALAIARRGEAAEEVAPGLHAVDVAQTRSAIARALFALGDVPRLLEHLPRFLAAADALGPTDAGRARFHAHLLVARAALDVGEFELARRHIGLAEDESRRDPGVVGHTRHAIASARARLAREERDAEGLVRALEQTPTTRASDLPRLAARAGLEAAARALCGDVAGASALATRALSILSREPGRRTVSPATRLAEADAIARLALEVGMHPEVADEALRIAADAAFERLLELEAAAKDLPAFGTPTDDDYRALGDYRARFVRRHRVALTRLRDRIDASARAGALSSWAHAGEEGLTTICAWCLSVRDADGAWLPLGHLLPTTPALPVTHGICPRCRIEETTTDARARR